MALEYKHLNMSKKYECFLKTFSNFENWKEIEVKEFESCVEILDSTKITDYKKKEAVQVMSQFINKENFWMAVLPVIKFSRGQQTKLFILDILQKFVKFKWKKLSSAQRKDFKSVIFALLWMCSKSNDENHIKILHSINMVLVQILENDYPDGWSTSVRDLLDVTKGVTSNAVWCANSLIILNHMSKKIVGRKQLSWLKSKQIRESNAEFFLHIFLMCEHVLTTSYNSGLLSCALETMMRFLNWIPPKIIHESDFVQVLIRRLNTIPNQVAVMKLLIAIVDTCPPKYHLRLVPLFTQYLKRQVAILSPTAVYELSVIIKNASSREKLLHLTIFLNTILIKHGNLLRYRSPRYFNVALTYLISIASLNDMKVVKLSLEYLLLLVRRLRFGEISKDSFDYKSIMTRLRKVIVANIYKPKLSALKNPSNQDVKRIKKVIVTSTQVYVNMKIILDYLNHLDRSETIQIIIWKLFDTIKCREFSEKSIISICSAAISIKIKSVRNVNPLVRCISEEGEKKFFWYIVKGLLISNKFIKGKNNKITFGLTFINFLAEYAEYLNSNPDFLKVTIIKLFQFMCGSRSDAKEVACKAFIRIAENCRRMLSTLQYKNMTFYDHILKDHKNMIISALEPHQVLYFYEALAHITVGFSKGSISDEIIIKERVQKFISPVNRKCVRIFRSFTNTNGIMLHPVFVTDVITIFNINSAICKGMGFEYMYQLYSVFPEMLPFYTRLSRKLSTSMGRHPRNGICVIDYAQINALKVMRKGILKLISTWVDSIKEKHQGSPYLEMFLEKYLPHLIHVILGDYYNNSFTSLYEPEVLSLFTTIVKSLKGLVRDKIEVFFSFILDPTVQIIKDNADETFEIRKNFLLFIQAITTHCFEAFYLFLKDVIEEEPNIKIEVILSLILRCIKDEKKKTVTLGLQTLLLLLERFRQSDLCLQFHQKFYFIILKDILFASQIRSSLDTFDMEHKAFVLSHMLNLIAKEDINQPLNPLEQTDEIPNDIYVQIFIGQYIYKKCFELTEEQLEFIVNGIFNYHQKIPSLVEFLKNIPLLIQEFYEENAIAQAYKEYQRKQALQNAEIEQNAQSEETRHNVLTEASDAYTLFQNIEPEATEQNIETEATKQNTKATENNQIYIDESVFDLENLD